MWLFCCLIRLTQPNFRNNWFVSYRLKERWSVKGFTQEFPGLDDELRGRYRALTDERVLDYLEDLGITGVEWLPIQAGADDDFLVTRKLTNYWGYNTLGFFAPSHRFASPRQAGAIYSTANQDCQAMVNAMHRRGIECWMDVVYNHTSEGNEEGPTLCFRGLDNASYYRLSEDKRTYLDESGCGNTVNLSHPRVLQMVMDSLRYWVNTFGIDGFRFDLATILGRNPIDFDARSAFLSCVRQDPDLENTRMVAEPWDIGNGGYQLGSFPPGWSEWNDRYRDGVRRFWANEEGTLPPLADLLLGSYQSFFANDRGPVASVNFVTAHDGFTLNDLVSYEQKHNEANGEDNRDGHGSNYAYNHGVEGTTDDVDIIAERGQAQRNILSTLLLSQGVPMLLAGDELRNSQGGNNNAYCQDNPIGWINWPEHPTEHPQFRFVKHLIAVRQKLAVLRQRNWLHGTDRDPHWALPNISWLNESAQIMTSEQWSDPYRQMVMMLLVDHQPADEESSAVLLMINNSDTNLDVPLDTDQMPTGRWRCWVNTSDPGCTDSPLNNELEMNVPAKTVVLLRCYTEKSGHIDA